MVSFHFNPGPYFSDFWSDLADPDTDPDPGGKMKLIQRIRIHISTTYKFGDNNFFCKKMYLLSVMDYDRLSVFIGTQVMHLTTFRENF